MQEKRFQQKYHYFYKFLSLYFIILLPSNCAKFIFDISGLERQCFYEIMSGAEKYSLETIPKNSPKYQLQISHNFNGYWKSIYYKAVMTEYEKMQIHKFALQKATYAFCIKNTQNFKKESNSYKSDTENLNNQLIWLQNQKEELYRTIKKIEQKKIQNVATSALLSAKMVLFAVIGLISIVVINYLYFREIKHIFKVKKLI